MEEKMYEMEWKSVARSRGKIEFIIWNKGQSTIFYVSIHISNQGWRTKILL
jgi:hypothetical protein